MFLHEEFQEKSLTKLYISIYTNRVLIKYYFYFRKKKRVPLIETR